MPLHTQMKIWYSSCRCVHICLNTWEYMEPDGVERFTHCLPKDQTYEAEWSFSGK